VTVALGIGSLSGAAGSPARGATCGDGSTTLQDGGFEAPVIDADSYSELLAPLVPPWQTTDSLNDIEIWSTGFLGVPSEEGSQFAELNANTPGTLYQDVVTTPGETMTWTVQHRGRKGEDTMRVLIGDAATADVGSDTGWNFLSADLTDGTDAWGAHTDTYVVPAGQTCTRFGFRAVSSTGGDPSIGNFLDAVGFEVAAPPTPTPSPSPTASLRPTVRPTPPATATIAPNHGSGNGPSVLLLALLVGLGLAVGSLSVAHQRKRRRG
jgi:hypothetical protein